MIIKENKETIHHFYLHFVGSRIDPVESFGSRNSCWRKNARKPWSTNKYRVGQKFTKYLYREIQKGLKQTTLHVDYTTKHWRMTSILLIVLSKLRRKRMFRQRLSLLHGFYIRYLNFILSNHSVNSSLGSYVANYRSNKTTSLG